MFKSIRRRLTASYLLVIAVIVILMGASFIWFLNYFYMQNLKENLYNQARFAASLIGEMVGRGAETQEIDLRCKELGQELGVRITIVDKQGIVLADSAEAPARMDDHGDRPEVVEALKQDRGVAVRYSITLDEQMYYLAIPFYPSGDIAPEKAPSIIRLALPLAQIRETITGLIFYLLGALLLASLVALMVALFISAGITGPIEQISRASRLIAGGDYYPTLNVPGRDELADLAVNIRQMGTALAKKIDQVLFEKNKLETVVSSMGSGIIFTDSRLIIELINPAAAKLFEVELSSAIGKPVQNVVRYHTLLEYLKAAQLDGKQRLLEMNLYYPSTVILETYIVPVSTIAGSISGFLILFHEVTAMRSMEKMRSEFAANVSHELRTPLTTIRGYTETILNENLTGSQLAEFLLIIDRETCRLSALIDDLLDLSRIENEKDMIKKEEISLGELISDALGRISDQAERKGVRMAYDNPDTVVYVKGNYEWLCQALVNVLENSIRYGYQAGMISVSLVTERGLARVEISDNGPGIPAADIPFVFERFYRVDKARSRKDGGTGLGLSIVKHILEAHGAEYKLESREGLGTKFSFTLPVSEKL